MKKTVSILLSIILCLGTCVALSSCSGKKEGTYNIGIVQLVEHPALDAATEGFKQAIIDELGADAVSFDYQNAQNDANTCSTIVNQFVSKTVSIATDSSTIPRFPARCPPVRDTLDTRNSRISEQRSFLSASLS